MHSYITIVLLLNIQTRSYFWKTMMWLLLLLMEVIKILYYNGKLLREKTFTNFLILKPPAKIFFMKFWHAISTYAIGLAFREMIFPTVLQSFLFTVVNAMKIAICISFNNSAQNLILL